MHNLTQEQRIHLLLAALDLALDLLEMAPEDFTEHEVGIHDQVISIFIDETAKEGVDVTKSNIPEEWVELW